VRQTCGVHREAGADGRPVTFETFPTALSEEIFERLAGRRGKDGEPHSMWRTLPEYGFPAASRFPITRSGESKIPDPFEGFERPVFGK